MGGQTPTSCRGFPSCDFRILRRCGGVAGWNIALKVRSARECELGTLLGPEETPVWCFLVAIGSG